MQRTFYAPREDGVRLFIRVTPGAGRDEIVGVWLGGDGDERLAIKIAAPPDKGKANAAVIKVIAAALRISKSSITIVAGAAARLKSLEIDGDAAALTRALAAFTK